VILLGIPRIITAGDSISWLDKFSEYSSPEYTLTYSLRGSSILDLTASGNSSSYETTITTAQSLALISGVIYFQAYVTRVGDRINIGNGQIEIKPNLQTALVPYDGSSYAEKTLAAIQATITAKLEGGAVQRYKIGNREVENFTLKELTEMEGYWRFRVNREAEQRGDRPSTRNLYMGFGHERFF